MYGQVLSTTAPVAAAVTVATLPNTGSNVWVTVALAVAAGMLTWGALYKKRSPKQQ